MTVQRGARLGGYIPVELHENVRMLCVKLHISLNQFLTAAAQQYYAKLMTPIDPSQPESVIYEDTGPSPEVLAAARKQIQEEAIIRKAQEKAAREPVSLKSSMICISDEKSDRKRRG
jgi:predicted HD phosphohydrolase